MISVKTTSGTNQPLARSVSSRSYCSDNKFNDYFDSHKFTSAKNNHIEEISDDQSLTSPTREHSIETGLFRSDFSNTKNGHREHTRSKTERRPKTQVLIENLDSKMRSHDDIRHFEYLIPQNRNNDMRLTRKESGV